MARSIRLIPRLDIKGPNLVKGIQLEGLRVLGKPERFAEYYYEHGADELLFVDVVASLYGRNSLLDIIERTSKKIFIPLTVTGGIRSLDDIHKVLRAGGDKVALNTAAVARPELVREAAQRYGSSTIVISIEAVKRKDGSYEAMTDNGREHTGLDALAWAKRATALGAGEVLVTSVDREGTGRGFELDLIASIAQAVPVPVIAAGGAGSADHLAEAAIQGQAQAIAAASIFHYNFVRHSPNDEGIAAEINTTHIRSASGFAKVQDATLDDIHTALLARGVRSLARLSEKAA
jgi:imidazole glycerol-phosphate synthase subunit HisF